MLMEEAMSSIPEQGSRRVKHLVNAFESLLSIAEGEEGGRKERKNVLMDWLMPNLREEVEGTSLHDFSSFELLCLRGNEREPRLCSSLDGLDVAFAYAGHNVVLEIQATMPSSPERLSKKPMWKGVIVAYIIVAICYFPVAFLGYYVFGN